MMTELPHHILHRIGNTSLLPLRNIVPRNGGKNSSRILLKLESENPTGSMKDRQALAMMEAAEADGRLRAGGSVVEYTGGSTGVSLSLVCAVKRYPLHIVSSDAFSKEKLDHMRILGAKLQIVPSESGGMTEKLTRDMVEAARIIAERTGAFWTDQLNNKDQLAGYHKLARRSGSKRTARSTVLSRAWVLRPRFEGSRKGYAAITRESKLLPSSPPNRLSCRAASQGLTKLTVSERALWSRFGATALPIRSRGCPPTRLWLWPFDWPRKRASSRGPPPAAMSSPLCDWPNSWDRARRLSPSCATRG